jgi:hypothetical protein
MLLLLGAVRLWPHDLSPTKRLPPTLGQTARTNRPDKPSECIRRRTSFAAAYRACVVQKRILEYPIGELEAHNVADALRAQTPAFREIGPVEFLAVLVQPQ